MSIDPKPSKAKARPSSRPTKRPTMVGCMGPPGSGAENRGGQPAAGHPEQRADAGSGPPMEDDLGRGVRPPAPGSPGGQELAIGLEAGLEGRRVAASVG